jgi:TatD DNase family protein
MYKLIDSHCHLDFDAFDKDRGEVIEYANNSGICRIIIPGVKRDDWERIRQICDQNERLHACYGLHPYLAEEHSDDDILQLRAWLNDHDCVAVGECGLDYRKNQADQHLQMKFFDAQLDIAHSCNKPVVIHAVHATTDVIRVIKNYPGLRGMVHSYSGSYEQAMQLIELQFFISLGGAITYENARKIRAAASKIPLDSILLETDAPDQPDAAHAGQRNEPAYLVNVLQCLSELRNESAEEIAEQTTANARRLFRI